MRIVVFAGGAGRRLWPISRVKSPKQFEPIVDGRSTLQLVIDNLLTANEAADIFVSTNVNYSEMIRDQLPMLSAEHVIGEPVRRDLAPAVGLALIHLVKAEESAVDEPVAILWGDSVLTRVETFSKLLDSARILLQRGTAEIFFIGETPRFANHNLGWIGLGDPLDQAVDVPAFHFKSITYRPPQQLCEEMYAARSHVWNTGYFITTPGYVIELYRRFQPLMWDKLSSIGAAIGRPDYEEVLQEVYPQLESISFDDAILTHIPDSDAAVLHDELGWSDPGTLYALKEALQPAKDQNLTKGLVIEQQSHDSLLYNYEEKKLLVAIGLEGMVVVNTEDALLVVHKDDIPLVKRIVESLDERIWSLSPDARKGLSSSQLTR